MQPPSASVKLYILVLAITVTALYAQSLSFDFVNYDDYDLVYENSSFLSDPSNIARAFASHAFVGKRETSVYYRPVLQASYIIDYRLWGLNPLGYHATNIMLHAVTTIFLFLLLNIMLKERLISLMASMLFAFHPIQVESVAWIAGRNDILVGLFTVLMLYFYAQHRHHGEKRKYLLWLSSLSFVFAIFTKESAAFYLLLLPLYDITTPDTGSGNPFWGNLLRKLLPFVILLCGYLLLRNILFGEFIGSEKLYGKLSPMLRLRLIPAMIAEHLSLILLPIGLSVEHPLDKLIWLDYPWDIISYFVTGALATVVYIAWRIRRSLSFGLLWLLVGFFPLLNVIPLAVPILEHRLYTATAGFVLILVGWMKYFTPQKHFKIATALVGIILAIYAVGTSARLPVWKNSETLWLDAINKAPTAPRSYFNLAGYYYEQQQYEKSFPLLRKYTELRPDDFMGYSKLRQTYFALGRYEETIDVCRQMIALDPQGQNRYIDLGVLFERLSMPDSAIIFYRETLSENPEFYKIHDRLGTLYFNSRLFDSARSHYRAAIDKNKEYADAYFNLGTLYYSLGNSDSALSVITEGIKYGEPPMRIQAILDQLKTAIIDPGKPNSK